MEEILIREGKYQNTRSVLVEEALGFGSAGFLITNY